LLPFFYGEIFADISIRKQGLNISNIYDDKKYMEEKIVYFLDLEDDTDFLNLISWKMRRYKIILMPVDIKRLREVLSKRSLLVTFVRSVESKALFQKLRSSHFDISMLNNKLNLVEFSSFESKKVSKFKDSYSQYLLPISFKEVGELISMHANELHESDRLWPGGRRCRIRVEM